MGITVHRARWVTGLLRGATLSITYMSNYYAAHLKLI